MNRRNALKAMAGLALCPLCAQKGIAAEGAHWSYEGDGGPAKWGDLDAANKVCAIGSQQSPIDIGATIRSRLPELEINWTRRADTIVNNGHTIQLNFAKGNTMRVQAPRPSLRLDSCMSPPKRCSVALARNNPKPMP